MPHSQKEPRLVMGVENGTSESNSGGDNMVRKTFSSYSRANSWYKWKRARGYYGDAYKKNGKIVVVMRKKRKRR